MINWSDDINIQLYSTPIDMRKQLDGLLMLVESCSEEGAKSRHLYLFFNRQRDKIKGLFWDHNGFILLYKRLEKGRFKLKDIESDLSLNPEQLR